MMRDVEVASFRGLVEIQAYNTNIILYFFLSIELMNLILAIKVLEMPALSIKE